MTEKRQKVRWTPEMRQRQSRYEQIRRNPHIREQIQKRNTMWSSDPDKQMLSQIEYRESIADKAREAYWDQEDFE